MKELSQRIAIACVGLAFILFACHGPCTNANPGDKDNQRASNASVAEIERVQLTLPQVFSCLFERNGRFSGH